MSATKIILVAGFTALVAVYGYGTLMNALTIRATIQAERFMDIEPETYRITL
jgi:hypothetical protein